MPVPTAITDLSQTAGSNFPTGGDTPSSLDDTQRAHGSFIALLRDGKGFSAAVTLASATTTDIGAQNSFFVNVSGTTPITSFGANYNGPRYLRFTGALPLTHHATNLILPTGANITTAANDSALFIPTGSGWACVAYQKADGTALSAATVIDYLNTTRIDVASASTVNLTSSAPNTRHINITGTTTINGFTVAAGQCYFVRFAAALTLTNGAGLTTQTGANITTAAGDTCLIRATASDTVEVLFYTSVAGIASASESVAGIVELADSSEAAAGTDATRALTPSTLRSGVNASGSAPIYAARAWVNFNGTGTVAIRASGNVSSITDNGTGDYTVNFSAALPDANFATFLMSNNSANDIYYRRSTNVQTSTSVQVKDNYTPGDSSIISVAVFR